MVPHLRLLSKAGHDDHDVVSYQRATVESQRRTDDVRRATSDGSVG